MRRMAARGRIVICPVVMNHAAFRKVDAKGLDGAYWRELESRLAVACDGLTVIKLPGWRESRGVQREISIFELLSKPIEFVEYGAEREILA